MDRFKLRPYGRKGGEAGTLGSCILDPGTPKERSISKIDILKLERGDVVRIYSPGGGAYGAPLDREPASVLRDIADGFLTEEEAGTVYGIVLSDHRIDEPKTQALRDRIRQGASSAEEFVFGKERASYEATLPVAFQDMLARLLADKPAAVRQYARGRLYAIVEKDGSLLDLPPAELERKVTAELDRLFTSGVAAVEFA